MQRHVIRVGMSGVEKSILLKDGPALDRLVEFPSLEKAQREAERRTRNRTLENLTFEGVTIN